MFQFAKAESTKLLRIKDSLRGKGKDFLTHTDNRKLKHQEYSSKITSFHSVLYN